LNEAVASFDIDWRFFDFFKGKKTKTPNLKSGV
jgi:hypothetical protein